MWEGGNQRRNFSSLFNDDLDINRFLQLQVVKTHFLLKILWISVYLRKCRVIRNLIFHSKIRKNLKEGNIQKKHKYCVAGTAPTSDMATDVLLYWFNYPVKSDS